MAPAWLTEELTLFWLAEHEPREENGGGNSDAEALHEAARDMGLER